MNVKGKWVAGIRFDGDSAAGVLIHRTGNTSRVVGEFHRPRQKVENAESFAAIVRELAPGLKLKNLTLAFLLGDGPIAFEVKSFPVMKTSDFRKAATWYLQQNRRTEVENPCFGAWTHAPHGSIAVESVSDALLLETDQNNVDRLMVLGQQLGAGATFIVPVPFAYHSLMTDSETEVHSGTTLLVETREKDSALTVFQGDRLLLHRSVDLSPDPFELTLIDIPGIGEGNDGGGTATRAEPAVDVGISTTRLVTEIARTNQYVESRFQFDVEGICLTTGNETVREILEAECGLPVSTIASPHRGDEQDEEIFLAPHGAALKVIQGGETGLLPQVTSSRLARGMPLVPRRIVLRGAVQGLILVFVLQLAATMGMRYTEKQLGSVNAQYIAMVDRYIDPDFEARLSEWERHALTINRFRSNQYLWSDLGVVISRLMPAGVLLERLEGAVPENREIELAEDDPFAMDDPLAGTEEDAAYFEDDLGQPWFEIRGRAGHIDLVRSFMENLEESREFQHVLLVGADRDPEEERQDIVFQINSIPMVKRETYVNANLRAGRTEPD